ncbi:MAG: hypothetical protein IJ646_00935 [Clostridia bacterium]|nr:hypothetical protein [Clostridia bacterium]
MARKRGGGPPRFEDVGDIEARIDAYFEACRGELLTEGGKVVLDKRGKPVMNGERPPTLTGLALALGFTSRAGMMGYKGKAEYEAAILRGRSRVEQYAEEQLFDKEASAGARFVLENDFQGRRFADEDDGDAVMDEVRKRMGVTGTSSAPFGGTFPKGEGMTSSVAADAAPPSPKGEGRTGDEAS